MNISNITNYIPNETLSFFLKGGKIEKINKEVNLAAIDIGYGYTKYIAAAQGEDCSPGYFPSISVIAPPDDIMGDFFVTRDTKKITNGGVVWEVGPDIGDISDKNNVRPLNDTFVESEQWKVLLLGALAYLNVPDIDVLVLGLPVGQMMHSKRIIERAKGVHKVSDDLTVSVRDVMVIPQPLGTLYSHIVSSKANMIDGNTLIIDPGYLTFDFLVSKGFAVNAHRSGSRPGGMASILSAIAQSISKVHDVNYSDLSAIDEALRVRASNGGESKIQLYSEMIDLEPHLASTSPIIKANLDFMLNKIGDTQDIKKIIVSGGPSMIYGKRTRISFPQNEIEVMENSIFANVTGFLYWVMIAYYVMASKKK